MGTYDRQIASAKRLIEKFGEKCSWMQPGTPVVTDTAQPWITTPGSATTHRDTPIVFLPRNRVNTQFLQALNPSLMTVGKVYGLMGAVAFVPTLGDYVVRSNGSVAKILAIDVLAPDGTPILYTIDFDV